MNSIKLHNSYRKTNKYATKAGIYKFNLSGLTKFRVLDSKITDGHDKKFRHRAWAKARVTEEVGKHYGHI